MSQQLPTSVKRFERILFTGLRAVNLNPKDFHPRLLEAYEICTIFPDAYLGPGMAISQIAWDTDADSEQKALGQVSTIVVTQDCLFYFADLVEPEKKLFEVIHWFNNELPPEMFAAMYLAHMVKGEPLYPPGKRPFIANGQIHIKRDLQEA